MHPIQFVGIAKPYAYTSMPHASYFKITLNYLPMYWTEAANIEAYFESTYARLIVSAPPFLAFCAKHLFVIVGSSFKLRVMTAGTTNNNGPST
jgi:hypothetical protein